MKTPINDELWSRDRGSESLLAHAREMESQASRLAAALEHIHDYASGLEAPSAYFCPKDKAEIVETADKALTSWRGKGGE